MTSYDLLCPSNSSKKFLGKFKLIFIRPTTEDAERKRTVRYYKLFAQVLKSIILAAILKTVLKLKHPVRCSGLFRGMRDHVSRCSLLYHAAFVHKSESKVFSETRCSNLLKSLVVETIEHTIILLNRLIYSSKIFHTLLRRCF